MSLMNYLEPIVKCWLCGKLTGEKKGIWLHDNFICNDHQEVIMMNFLNYDYPEQYIGCHACQSENLEVLFDFSDDPDWTWNEDLTELGHSNFVFCNDCYSMDNMIGISYL